jgi:hypothetical protein
MKRIVAGLAIVALACAVASAAGSNAASTPSKHPAGPVIQIEDVMPTKTSLNNLARRLFSSMLSLAG